VKGLARQVGYFLLYGLLGVLLAVVAGAAVFLESRGDLEIWHTVELEHEYHAKSRISSFAEYVALEERLFQELEDKVVVRTGQGSDSLLNRYSDDSLSSPTLWERNWNRSFEFSVSTPRGGVLMLHGMSDSPYSMRGLAERLHAQGFQVVGLRYPGHGTAPSSLTETSWEDMAGATRLAALHLAAQLDGAPFYVFGYSTGGPLAVDLALDAIEERSIIEDGGAAAGDTLPVPAGLVLFSPAMGVTPLAALAPWQDRLGRVLGLEKFAWNSLVLEYDPFKYRSFPLNAAIQVWRLSSHLEQRMAALAGSDVLDAMPPVLTFQSAVDDTIAVGALLDALYNKLPEGEHGIVAYDINRTAGMDELLANDPGPALNRLLVERNRSFDFTVITNASPVGERVIRKYSPAGRGVEQVCQLAGRWPRGVYSLTHIALTFPPDDPLYGGPDARQHPGIQLGNVVLRGEGSALSVSPAGFLRQTWNPFFEYQYSKLSHFMGIGASVDCPLDG